MISSTFKTFITLALVAAAASIFFGFSAIAHAGTAHNMYGIATSANIGDVLLNNCTDPTDATTCSGVDYGVNYDTVTGEFSGHAWNNAIGWISFDVNPNPFNPAPYTNTSGEWAKAVNGGLTGALGWTGWIDLDDVVYDSLTGTFSGYGWDGFDNNDDDQTDTDSGIGWINFNVDIAKGCTDPTSVDYNSLAVFDDGSCSQAPLCGNGILDTADGETCDDGNLVNGDGCSALCQDESGNPGNPGNPGGSGVCGDGSLDSGEQCDDGNLTSGDGCSSICQDESGNPGNPGGGTNPGGPIVPIFNEN